MINTHGQDCLVDLSVNTARIIASTSASVVKTIAISAKDAKRSAVIKQLNGVAESQSTVVADLIAS
jgi:hypothetical protein